MKRKRIEFEYTLVDEYLQQREKETLKKLREIKEPTPKKPLLPKFAQEKVFKKPSKKELRSLDFPNLVPKVNVTKRNRKSNP